MGDSWKEGRGERKEGSPKGAGLPFRRLPWGCLRENRVNLGQTGGETLQLSQRQGKVLPIWQDVDVTETCPTGCSPSRQDPGLPSGCPGLWRDWPHGVKSRWCFIGCDSIQRLHTDGPRHAGGAQAQRQNDGRHPQSTLSSAAPGAPCAGNGMRGFYETTPCLLRAGFSKCENRHLKKTWDQEESEDAGRAGRTEAARGARTRSHVLEQGACAVRIAVYCMASLRSDGGPRPWPATRDTMNFWCGQKGARAPRRRASCHDKTPQTRKTSFT